MDTIPKIANDEIFKAIDEQPGYYISNYKRIYSMKTNKIIYIEESRRFKNGKAEKVYIKPLYIKYFNQPNEDDLIAIIKYNDYKFKDLYYDRLKNKFYKFINHLYIEIEQHKRSNSKTYFINVEDVDGNRTKLSTNKIKNIL